MSNLKRLKNDFLVYSLIIVFLLLPPYAMLLNDHPKVDATLVANEKFFAMVIRRIRLNQIEIKLISTNWTRIFNGLNKSFLWKDLNGIAKTADMFLVSTPIKSSPCDLMYLEPNEYGIDSSKIFNATEVKSKKLLSYIFLVNYTGDYYHETIVFGYNITDDIYSAPQWLEVNRTEFISNSEEEKYNPSIPLYRALYLLNRYNLPYTFVHEILLIPKNLLNSTFSKHEFIWVISISNQTVWGHFIKITPNTKLEPKDEKYIYPISRYIFYFDEKGILLHMVIKHELYLDVTAER